VAARVPGDVADAELEVHLVPMRRRHLRSVLRIESQVYPRPWSLSLFMSELALRSSRAYFVARVGGMVVGYCGLMLTGDDAHVTTIAVDPAWHRHKILTLEVRVGNEAAQAMYRTFGFHPAGIRKNYYVETNEDALVMWADDIDTEAYAERLDRIEAAVPGVTIVEQLG
jgi:ribosomal-protein-alanine N-acetyltransferase